MLDRLALHIEAAWYAPPRWLLALVPLEWLFALIAALRRQAFARGWLASEHPGVPVVVVGNITVGGTGKTPVVIAISRALTDKGLAVGVVSRGYAGSARGVRRVEEDSLAQQVGDEALLIARSTTATVMVGRDRVAAARELAAAGVDVILSDDGLQHYALRRDIEVVTMDAELGFGNGHLLPVGPLREPPRRLATVDFLLQRGGSDPHSGTGYRPLHFRRLHGADTRAVDQPGFGPRVHAVAAIARPQRFFATLRGLGLEPVEHPLPDHGVIAAEFLATLTDCPLIMTAKDGVKCAGRDHPDAWVLEMEVEFPERFIDRLHEKIQGLKGKRA